MCSLLQANSTIILHKAWWDMKVKLNIVKHNHFSFSFFQKCEENLTIQICNNRNSSTKQKLIISVQKHQCCDDTIKTKSTHSSTISRRCLYSVHPNPIHSVLQHWCWITVKLGKKFTKHNSGRQKLTNIYTAIGRQMLNTSWDKLKTHCTQIKHNSDKAVYEMSDVTDKRWYSRDKRFLKSVSTGLGKFTGFNISEFVKKLVVPCRMVFIASVNECKAFAEESP